MLLGKGYAIYLINDQLDREIHIDELPPIDRSGGIMPVKKGYFVHTQIKHL